jgi:hypothetical protein
MKPIQNSKWRSNCWKPARRVWFQRNDDREWTAEDRADFYKMIKKQMKKDARDFDKLAKRLDRGEEE